MKILDNLMTVQMKPQEYQKKLDNYRNHMFMHIGVVVLVDILIRLGVNYSICFLVASIVLIDELIRIKFFRKIGQLVHPGNSTEVYYVDEYGRRTSQTSQALLFCIIVFVLLCMLLGYVFALYFLLVDGVRIAFAAYKANKVYGLGINQMPYYIIALAGSVGVIVLRYVCILMLG